MCRLILRTCHSARQGALRGALFSLHGPWTAVVVPWCARQLVTARALRERGAACGGWARPLRTYARTWLGGDGCAGGSVGAWAVRRVVALRRQPACPFPIPRPALTGRWGNRFRCRIEPGFDDPSAVFVHGPVAVPSSTDGVAQGLGGGQREIACSTLRTCAGHRCPERVVTGWAGGGRSLLRGRARAVTTRLGAAGRHRTEDTHSMAGPSRWIGIFF